MTPFTCYLDHATQKNGGGYWIACLEVFGGGHPFLLVGGTQGIPLCLVDHVSTDIYKHLVVDIISCPTDRLRQFGFSSGNSRSRSC